MSRGTHPCGPGSCDCGEGKKVHVPDLPAPAGVCWRQGPLMHRCDRRKGHTGPHLWELTAENTRLHKLLDRVEAEMSLLFPREADHED